MTAPSGLGVIELGDVCAAFRARSLDLFEITGVWVSDTSDAGHQRWFAEASHRHAWHAQLWEDRSPAIPPVDADELVSGHRQSSPIVHDADRAARYREWLDAMIGQLDEIETRVMPELDPATVRAIALTRTDLVELCAR